MTESNKIPKVSMANTKKELLDAYEAMKKQLKIREKQRLDAQQAGRGWFLLGLDCGGEGESQGEQQW